jgi:thymidylate synthase
MKQLHDIYRHILTNGRVTGNRTKYAAKKVFGYQTRFNMLEGFPLTTTKHLHLRSIVHELLWFIMGGTNIQYLKDNKVRIWDEWATEGPVIELLEVPYQQRVRMYAEKKGIAEDAAFDYFHRISSKDGFHVAQATLTSEAIPTKVENIVVPSGEVGPMYGYQWRHWKGSDGKEYDQLADVIHTLKTNPTSRRIIVSAWKPEVLPNEKVSAQQNVFEGKQALAACHTMFHFQTAPATNKERWEWLHYQYEAQGSNLEDSDIWRAYYEIYVVKSAVMEEADEAKLLDDLGAPKLLLNLQLYQRSADAMLGVPFNIASYALLLHMVAQVTGMIPFDFVHTFGDLHLYENAFEAVDVQLQREPFPLAKLKLNPHITSIDDFTFDDITVIGYQHHGKLPDVEVAV